MSGRRIDDHGFWGGGKSKDSILSEGVKFKHEESVEGAGHVGKEYPDTVELIDRDQRGGVKKAKAHPVKSGYRN